MTEFNGCMKNTYRNRNKIQVTFPFFLIDFKNNNMNQIRAKTETSVK